MVPHYHTISQSQSSFSEIFVLKEVSSGFELLSYILQYAGADVGQQTERGRKTTAIETTATRIQVKNTCNLLYKVAASLCVCLSVPPPFF